MRVSAITGTLAAATIATAAPADTDRRIEDRSEFVQIVQGRDLTRLGVTLRVSGDGGISGRAFGKQVTGTWDWQGGFFCRTLNWGGKPFDHNCQQVDLVGGGVRFTSDRGAGQDARLMLR